MAHLLKVSKLLECFQIYCACHIYKIIRHTDGDVWLLKVSYNSKKLGWNMCLNVLGWDKI